MTKLPWLTGPQFAEIAHKREKWIIEDWLPEGIVVEMTGEQKTSGKSTFQWVLAKHIITGESFLDKPVKQGPVLYMTEQPGASFYEQTYKTGLLEMPDFH